MTPDAPDSPDQKRLLVVAAGLIGLAIPAAFFDASVFGWLTTDPIPGDLGKLLDRAETFGHFYGAAAIVLMIGLCLPGRRRSVARVFACAVTAGLLADVIKLIVNRPRPKTLLGDGEALPTVADTLPSWNTGFLFESGLQGFPSAHTAMAVGLAVGLSRMFPAGRRGFAVLAALVAVQRVYDFRHFPSDTLAGAACGLIAGYWWYDSRRARSVVAAWVGEEIGVGAEIAADHVTVPLCLNEPNADYQTPTPSTTSLPIGTSRSGTRQPKSSDSSNGSRTSTKAA